MSEIKELNNVEVVERYGEVIAFGILTLPCGSKIDIASSSFNKKEAVYGLNVFAMRKLSADKNRFRVRDNGEIERRDCKCSTCEVQRPHWIFVGLEMRELKSKTCSALCLEGGELSNDH